MERKLSELDYSTLVQMRQDEEITLAEFCRYAEGSTKDEYDEWCYDNNLDSDDEESAQKFMDYKEQQYIKGDRY